jgi:ribosomal protein S6--L-glutamate ligase
VIVSFHPRLSGDLNLRLPHRQGLGGPLEAQLCRAQAVLLPQSVREPHFRACAALCPHVFPDYSWRYGPEGQSPEGQTYEGKTGVAALCARFGLPHPRTLCFGSAASLRAHLAERGRPPLEYPFVLKGDRGGGGNWVFLIRSGADLETPLERLEAVGWPLVLQEYVDHGGRDARVVILGGELYGYWRRQPDPGEFRTNLGRGARVERRYEPGLLRSAEGLAAELRRRTGLNLAACDVILGPDRRPLLIEINYCFGRRGLPPYYPLLAAAVQRWLERLGLEGCQVRPIDGRLESGPRGKLAAQGEEERPWP